MKIVVGIALVLLLLAAGLAAWRFFVVRSKGSAVLFRSLVAASSRRWRYGAVRFDGERVLCYSLCSLSPKADLVFDRCGMSIRNRRTPTDREATLMAPGLRILKVRCHSGEETEFAVDPRLEMALTSWLESAPDERMQRIDIMGLRHRMGRARRRSSRTA